MSDQQTTTKMPMRDTLLTRDRTRDEVVTPVNATAVMVRTADALHRLERLAEAMEKVAAEGERQLAVVRGRL